MRYVYIELALMLPLAFGSCGCSDETASNPGGAWILDRGVERSSPDTLRVFWSSAPEQTVIVRAATTPSEAPAGSVVASVSGATEAVVSGLDPSKRWYFAVGTEGGPSAIVAERRVPLEGPLNFRDIGGYRTLDEQTVRWGIVFRSDALGSLTDADKTLLGSMGLRTVVDFRSMAEVERSPDPELSGVEALALPMELPLDPATVCASSEPVSNIIVNAYRDIVDQNVDLLASWVTRLVDEQPLPILSHCSAGTERTGIAIGLLLSALGVPDQTVLEDYALSGAFRERLAPRQREILASLGCTPERANEILSTPPDSMGAVLAHVRESYGSVESYLVSGGLDPATLVTLRDTLLE